MRERMSSLFEKRPWYGWAGILFLLAILLYANTLGHEYAWDDSIVITQNERVLAGTSRISEHFDFRDRSEFSDFIGFRPVALTSFSIDQEIAPLNPAFSHGVNIVLYALLCVVLFYTLMYLFPGRHPVFAFLVTLLFLVHPVHVEAVANVKSRDEILALLFALLALQCFFRQYRTGKIYWLPIWAICLLAAAWSKENGYFTVPVIVAALVLLAEGNLRKKLIGLAWLGAGLVVVVAVVFAVTGSAPGSITGVAENVYVDDLRLGNSFAVPQESMDRHANSAQLFALNLKTFFFPYQLKYYSGYAQIPLLKWPSLASILCLLLGLSWLAGAVFFSLRRRAPDLAFGMWFFAITVFIYLQPFGNYLADTIADRFLFMPSVGLCLLVIAGLYRLLKLDPAAGPTVLWQSSKGKIMVAGLGLIAVVLAGATLSRNTVWKDTYTLFSNDMPRLENCAKAHFYFANVLTEQKPTSTNPAKTKADIEFHLNRTIEITPKAFFAYLELARHHLAYKEYPKVEAAGRQAAAEFPKQPEGHYYLGLAQYHLRKYTQAAQNLALARSIYPSMEEAWELEGRSLSISGQHTAAIERLESAHRTFPKSTYMLDALSDAYYDSGQVEASFVPLEQLLILDGQNPVWWKKVIGRCQLVGDQDKAAEYYRKAVEKGVLE
jgi:Tfp pilus assembly protein PilF